MKSKFYNLKAILLLMGILTFIVGCSSTNNDDGKVLEPSPEKRAREFADKGGGIFGDINNRKKVLQHLNLQAQTYYGELL